MQRGKFSLKGDEIIQIFSPVLEEVIALVKGQISATKRKIKAVILVGGFGESAYLRKTLRAAVGSGIEILVAPNRSEFAVSSIWAVLTVARSWTAVVRGALMKGLVRAAPTAERVQVGSRSARKHYGHEAFSKYDASLGHSISRWYAYMPLCNFALMLETVNGIHTWAKIHQK